MKTKKHDTRWMVSVALMAAIIIVLANTPLGMIQLPIIKATTVHIPVIIGAILLGPSAGANLGWGYKEVRKEMEDLTQMKVAVGNDANMAALGEMWLGAGKGEKNLIMVTLGTGVGGGVIVNGQPVVGAHGAGGEIGHICVNYEEEDHCGCGNQGCLEQYASATGITRLAGKRLKADDAPSSLRDRKLSAKAVFDELKKGDKIAEEIVEEFGAYLGHALANLAAITDPSVIVIGGGVSKAGDILLKYVEKAFKERAFFANEDTRLVLATLGNDAGICGAAKLIL